MARKLPRLQRVLDAPALFSIAYGEIASSIYFALGIIAFHALGLTPLVLFAMGLLFLVVSLSYAEGTASVRETGGAATLVRVAYNDLGGFVTGWAIFLDYLIVIALSALFLPHYVAGALKVHALAENPWDVLVAAFVIVGVVVIRVVRRPALYAAAIVVAAIDLPRSLIAAIGTVVTTYVAIALVGLSAFPAPDGSETRLGTRWLHSPLVGIVTRIGSELPSTLADVLR